MSKDERSGYWIPCVWIFLSSKTKSLYKTCFLNILQYFEANFGKKPSPTRITVDFELGLQKSIEEIFPQTQIKSCYFQEENFE